MPVRSLRSSVLRWPERSAVLAAFEAWAGALQARCAAVLRVGAVGSCARGDWGVGSDLDVVVVIRGGDPASRACVEGMPTDSIPVPVDLQILDEERYLALVGGASRFGRVLRDEARWC